MEAYRHEERGLGALGAYRIEEPAAVAAFLQRHQYLEPLLAEAAQRLPRYFPQGELVLRLVYDPEEDREPEAIAFVRVDADPIEADRQMDRFDEDWWFDALNHARSRMWVTLEFV